MADASVHQGPTFTADQALAFFAQFPEGVGPRINAGKALATEVAMLRKAIADAGKKVEDGKLV